MMQHLIQHHRVASTFALLMLLLAQWFIFGSHAGAGFVTDDYNWLESVVPNGKVDYFRAFTATTGFFRPLVGFSFAVQYKLHGMDPRAFGLFNLLLHMLNIILVYVLLSNLTQTKALALPVTMLFALNVKANEMAVRWISSRTSLLCVFFMLLSLILLVKNKPNTGKTTRNTRYFLVGFFYLMALLAKETAVAVPIFVFLFTFINDPHGSAFLQGPFGEKMKKGAWSVMPFILPLAIYFGMRFNSDAMTPFNAPPYYRLSFAPGLMVKNIVEYIFRAGILDIFIFVLLLMIGWLWGIKRNPGGVWAHKVIFVAGGLWFLSFLLPILGLSVRSDLYAYFPQIGLHVLFVIWVSRFFDLAALFREGELNGDLQSNRKKKQQQHVIVISLILLLLFWTGYLRNRAEFFSKSPKLSTLFTSQLLGQTSKLKPGSRIWILDMHAQQKESPSRTINYGFNALLNLYYPQKELTGDIIPGARVTEWEEKKAKEDVRFRWQDNRLTRID